jgi:hypothetical protein
MAKKTAKAAANSSHESAPNMPLISSSKKYVDPALESLFASSVGVLK